MKKPIWQVALLAGAVVLAGCNKKTEDDANKTEAPAVPMTAAPADTVDTPSAGDDLPVADTEEAAVADDAAPAMPDDANAPIVEGVEYDEAAAATATQDAPIIEGEEVER